MNLLDRLAIDARRTQGARGAVGGDHVEAQAHDLTRDGDDGPLIAVAYADEHVAADGQLIADGQLRLGVGAREVVADAHDLASGFHFRAEHGVSSGEASEGHHGLLDAEVLQATIVGRQRERGYLLPRHDARRGLRKRHAGGLAGEGNGAACTRVRLDHVDDLVFDGELDVQQTDDAQPERKVARDGAQLGLHGVGQRERRGAARRVARVDTGLLDVLHDGANPHLLAVAQRVEVAFDGPFQEAVEVNRMVGRDLGGLRHVLLQLAAVVDDAHAAPAEHVTGTHEQREPDLIGDDAGFLEGGSLPGGRIGDAELVADGAEMVAVLG